MRYSYTKKELPGGSPIANALVIIAGAVVIGISIVLGFFAFIALSALILVSAAVIGIRSWWINRKLAAQRRTASSDKEKSPRSVIEGEFRVLGEDRDEA